MDHLSDAQAPGKRGRRQGLPDPTAGAVAAFAHALATLKVQAGDPSYDRMRAELGAMASKSALSAAARGHDLPSWETVWEFVRSLTPPDADLDPIRRDWRAQWESARSESGRSDGPVRADPPAGTRPAGRDRRLVILGLLVGATVGGVLWTLVAAGTSTAPPIDGDVAAFVGDVTVPDGTVVAGGEPFLKTWEIRNSGRVAWAGRALQRLPGAAGATCLTPPRVPVPDTAPGASVRVSVTVDAPPGPATCKVHWKMVDEQGRAYFPMSRPVYFEVVVGG